ncbi:MAG: hypothetical protein H6745_28275 [Deltaproteobacteria bacterium]|nr:hypothetical protein [Deltaproteobacteria bacterium]
MSRARWAWGGALVNVCALAIAWAPGCGSEVTNAGQARVDDDAACVTGGGCADVLFGKADGTGAQGEDGAGGAGGDVSCAGVTTGKPQTTCVVADPEPALDDFEDGDGLIVRDGCRDGFWLTYADGQTLARAHMTPLPGDPVVPDEGGVDGAGRALRVRADDVAGGGYAGVSLNFVTNREACGQPGVPYDASAFSGIRLAARVVTASGREVLAQLKLNDVYTHAAGGFCAGGCYDAFTSERTLSGAWQTVQLPFAEPAQEGWGDRSPNARADVTRLYSFSVQVGELDEPFELWLDDVRFYLP